MAMVGGSRPSPVNASRRSFSQKILPYLPTIGIIAAFSLVPLGLWLATGSSDNSGRKRHVASIASKNQPTAQKRTSSVAAKDSLYTHKRSAADTLAIALANHHDAAKIQDLEQMNSQRNIPAWAPPPKAPGRHGGKTKQHKKRPSAWKNQTRAVTFSNGQQPSNVTSATPQGRGGAISHSGSGQTNAVPAANTAKGKNLGPRDLRGFESSLRDSQRQLELTTSQREFLEAPVSTNNDSRNGVAFENNGTNIAAAGTALQARANRGNATAAANEGGLGDAGGGGGGAPAGGGAGGNIAGNTGAPATTPFRGNNDELSVTQGALNSFNAENNFAATTPNLENWDDDQWINWYKENNPDTQLNEDMRDWNEDEWVTWYLNQQGALEGGNPTTENTEPKESSTSGGQVANALNAVGDQVGDALNLVENTLNNALGN